jgi:DNA-binding IclR family transcriptional regulator
MNIVGEEESQGTAIQSVSRAFAVLKLFAPERSTLNANQVAVALGMNRTTAWRYLKSLADAEVLEQIGNTTNFRLTASVLRLSEVFLSPWKQIIEGSRPYLERLRDQTGETAALHLRQGYSRIVVSQVESPHELRRVYHLNGDPIPLHLGAPSTAILYALPPVEIQSFLATLDPATPNLGKLPELLTRFRKAGCAVSVSERTVGSSAVAAPVVNLASLPIASVGVSGPTSRLTSENLEQIRPAVIAIARQISVELVGASA